MNSKPILFRGDMVRAVLAGTKTQTRRLNGLHEINRSPDRWGIFRETDEAVTFIRTGPPHRRVTVRKPWCAGWKLWVRETFGAKKGQPVVEGVYFRADGENPRVAWRPSIFMPRECSRITLVVKSVRAERLHRITEEDARAEGCEGNRVDGHAGYPEGGSPVDEFGDLWDEINLKRASWASNPWLWRTVFSHEKPWDEHGRIVRPVAS